MKGRRGDHHHSAEVRSEGQAVEYVPWFCLSNPTAAERAGILCVSGGVSVTAWANDYILY